MNKRIRNKKAKQKNIGFYKYFDNQKKYLEKSENNREYLIIGGTLNRNYNQIDIFRKYSKLEPASYEDIVKKIL